MSFGGGSGRFRQEEKPDFEPENRGRLIDGEIQTLGCSSILGQVARTHLTIDFEERVLERREERT